MGKAKAESMEPYFRKDTGLHAFKIVTEDGIAGFITCRVDAGRKVGVICNNAVEPGSQGKGLGSMMYEFILDFFREKGMTAAEVSTMKHDAYLPARKAYEKAGFSRKLERLTYYKKL